MTVRDIVEAQSPDGVVLSVEDVRKCLGIGTAHSETTSSAGGESLSTGGSRTPSSADTDPGRPQVLLVGHDMRNDLPAMEKDGIDLGKHLHYSGCADTHIMIEDTGKDLPKSLTDLMQRYDLAECHYVQTRKKGQRWVFVGAHNAANDAIAALKVLVAQALDLELTTHGEDRTEPDDEEWYNRPLPGMNKNTVLLAYDREGVENPRYKPSVLNRTSEHGFAWLRQSDVAAIAPGLHGENWRSHIQAAHWINRDFENYENKDYLAGNSKGFWKEYGKSQCYGGRNGPYLPAPFDELFKKLAEDAKVQSLATDFRALHTKTPEPANLPSSPAAIPTAQRDGTSSNGESKQVKVSSDNGASTRRSKADRSNRQGAAADRPSAGPENASFTASAESESSVTAESITTKPDGSKTTATVTTSSKTRTTFSWAQVAGKK